MYYIMDSKLSLTNLILSLTILLLNIVLPIFRQRASVFSFTVTNSTHFLSLYIVIGYCYAAVDSSTKCNFTLNVWQIPIGAN